MYERNLLPQLKQLLSTNSAVVLTGPRQVGKTTLALKIASSKHSVYLDLESPRDLAKVADIEAFCELHDDKLIVFDEVQRFPNLFAPLRSIIDRRRRLDRRFEQFLLLGSASIPLLKQSGESLAGRVAYAQLAPLNILEVSEPDDDAATALFLRGGYPDSYLAQTDAISLSWRENFIRTYLERDIPQFGPRIPAETLRRFWTMLAHNQGELFNAASLARGLDASSVTIARYLDLLVDLLLVRRLQPWHSNLGRRLIKSPKVYIRDSGLCHALLGIESFDSLLAHPVIGGSWEGYVVEQVSHQLSHREQLAFYRTSAGAEIDLIVAFADGQVWAIEIKRSSAPTISKGFYSACEDIKPNRSYVIHSGHDSYPYAHGVMAMSVIDFLKELQAKVHHP